MHRRDIMLNDFFKSEFIDKALAIYGFSKTNDYPNFSEELERYSNILKKTKRASGLFNFGETFVQKINIDDINLYVVKWSISAVKKVIKKYSSPERKFTLNSIVHVVDQKHINKSHLDVSLNNKTPIILASYPPMAGKTKFLIIDGNHRVISKHNDGQQEILGYMLEPHEHMEAMVSDIHRTLFKIHFNYLKIASYIGGMISRQELDEILYIL